MARFRNGPEAGRERVWAVGPVWRQIRLADLGGTEWAIVGGDGIGPPAPSTPWPGEVTYRLAETTLSDDPLVENVAWYELESASEQVQTVVPPGAFGDAIILIERLAQGPADDSLQHLARGWLARYTGDTGVTPTPDRSRYDR